MLKCYNHQELKDLKGDVQYAPNDRSVWSELKPEEIDEVAIVAMAQRQFSWIIGYSKRELAKPKKAVDELKGLVLEINIKPMGFEAHYRGQDVNAYVAAGRVRRSLLAYMTGQGIKGERLEEVRRHMETSAINSCRRVCLHVNV